MAILFARAFSFSQIIAPSVLTADTCYLSVKNTSAGSVLYLRRFAPIMLFTGTNAATAGVFALQRQAASPTGGSTITPTLHNPASVAPDVEIRIANAGLATVTPGAADRFKRFGCPSQNISVTEPPVFGQQDENIFQFIPGDCLLVIADTAIISGARAILDFTLYQD